MNFTLECTVSLYYHRDPPPLGGWARQFNWRIFCEFGPALLYYARFNIVYVLQVVCFQSGPAGTLLILSTSLRVSSKQNFRLCPPLGPSIALVHTH